MKRKKEKRRKNDKGGEQRGRGKITSKTIVMYEDVYIWPLSLVLSCRFLISKILVEFLSDGVKGI